MPKDYVDNAGGEINWYFIDGEMPFNGYDKLKPTLEARCIGYQAAILL